MVSKPGSDPHRKAYDYGLSAGYFTRLTIATYLRCNAALSLSLSFSVFARGDPFEGVNHLVAGHRIHSNTRNRHWPYWPYVSFFGDPSNLWLSSWFPLKTQTRGTPKRTHPCYKPPPSESSNIGVFGHPPERVFICPFSWWFPAIRFFFFFNSWCLMGVSIEPSKEANF